MSEYSEEFLTYLKEQENEAFLLGLKPALHDSPEGGNPTVGFGHKLTDAEVESGKVYGYDVDTMTVEQAEEVMIKDLRKHEASLKRELGEDFGELDQRRKEMLLDFQYNLGSAQTIFPDFTQAVIDGDFETMRKEYKRYFTNDSGETQELQSRNEAFHDLFLSSGQDAADTVDEFADIGRDLSMQPYAEEEVTYTVQPGDTLTNIAISNKVNMEDLMRANGILDANKIQAGQQLVMPLAESEQEEGGLFDTLEKGYDYAKSQVLDIFK